MAAKAKGVGARIDQLFKLRTNRLAQERKVEELKAQESALREEIQDELRKDNLTKATGKLATFGIGVTTVPRIDSDDPRAWQKCHRWIAKHGAFDILQKRFSDKGWRDRYEAGEKIPGTVPTPLIKISLTAVKR